MYNIFLTALRVYFLSVYPPRGSDITFTYSDDEPNGISKETKIIASNDNLRLLSSFLGLANNTPSLRDLVTWTIIAQNFFGWKGGWLYKLFSPLITIYNLVSMLTSLPFNILALATEILPGTVIVLADTMSYYNNKISYQSKFSPLNILATILQLIFYPILFIGRAISSPRAAIMKLWYRIDFSEKTYALRDIILIVLSLAITTVFYAALFPVLINLIAPSVMPALLNFVSFMTPFLNAIGLGVISIIGAFIPPLEWALLSFLPFIGLTAVFTFASTLLNCLLEGINTRNYANNTILERTILSVGIDNPAQGPEHDSHSKMNSSMPPGNNNGNEELNDNTITADAPDPARTVSSSDNDSSEEQDDSLSLFRPYVIPLDPADKP